MGVGGPGHLQAAFLTGAGPGPTWEVGAGAAGPSQPRPPCHLHQVLPAGADPRADAVGAHAPRGAPAGPGALARRVLGDGAGLDPVGRAAWGGGRWGRRAPRAHRRLRPPPAACSPSGSAATTAPTSPSTTASSRSSRRARRPRKRPAAARRARPGPPLPLLPLSLLSLQTKRGPGGHQPFPYQNTPALAPHPPHRGAQDVR